VCWHTVADDDDVMMSDWLDMVQKKNELVREESELIYRLHCIFICCMQWRRPLLIIAASLYCFASPKCYHLFQSLTSVLQFIRVMF